MNTITQTETKRRGRPPKAQEEAIVEKDVDSTVEDASPDSDHDDVILARLEPPNPPCQRCGKPLEKSRTLLRAYGLATYRCVDCRHVAIENDSQWYDFATAVSGNPPLIVERAAALHAARNRDKFVDGPIHGVDDAILSDSGDIRWSTTNLQEILASDLAILPGVL